MLKSYKKYKKNTFKNVGTSIILLILSINLLRAQSDKEYLEINTHARVDWYPPFSYSLVPVNSNTLNVTGKSFGIDLNYKRALNRKFYIIGGLGWYRYSFNKLRSENTQFGSGNVRIIDYPSSLYILFHCDEYWYNTISANVGLAKVIPITHYLEANASLMINNYFTYSQYYHITNNSDNHNYWRSDARYFGLSSLLTLSILQRLGRMRLGPNIILPLYDFWKTDQIFPEETNSGTRSKWLSGIGLGITCQFSLVKIKSPKKTLNL